MPVCHAFTATPCPKGSGYFEITFDDIFYAYEASAEAYYYPCGDPECDEALDIWIGDSYGFFLNISVTRDIDDSGKEYYPAWATLYDGDYNILASSDFSGQVFTLDNIDLEQWFSGEFIGSMVKEDVEPPPCESSWGDGRGSFDSWLNLNNDGWASYQGFGHVELIMADGNVYQIGNLSRISAWDAWIEPDHGGGYIDSPTMMIEIGDLDGQSGTGQIFTIWMDYHRALAGGDILIGEYGEAQAYFYDIYGGDFEAINGTLNFNEIGGQDGDLVIGHFDVQIENSCSTNPVEPSCYDFDTSMNTTIQTSLEYEYEYGYAELPVMVNIEYISDILVGYPVEIPATAYIYRDEELYDVGCGDVEVGCIPPSHGLYISLYFDETSGFPARGGADFMIPAEYLQDQTVYEFYDGMLWGEYEDIYISGNTMGTINLISAGGQSGAELDLTIQVDALSACFQN
jgi:hypothetical protein